MKKLYACAAGIAAIVAFSGCDIDQTRETKLPDVDVDVSAGQLPAFDVKWADVDAGTTTRTFKVPKLVVVMEEVEMEVPYVDVDMPDDTSGAKVERTIVVEAEVTEKAHDLHIERVYGTGDKLVVISRIEPNGRDLGDEKIRISDRIVINAPDLDVRHYIIGQRPEGEWNRQYRFVDNMTEIMNRIENATLIYSS